MSLTETSLDLCVKKELMEEWKTAKWSWFVQNEDDPWELRLPGKMKCEWSTQNGALIA